MDYRLLASKLKTSKLVIGDVNATIPNFRPAAPIGFVSFDLDYYSSTKAAFRIFQRNTLPRVSCYFDDIVAGGDTVGLSAHTHCDRIGELLAIKEYNEEHSNRHIGKLYGFGSRRMIRAEWNEKMFVHHNFADEEYTTYLGAEEG